MLTSVLVLLGLAGMAFAVWQARLVINRPPVGVLWLVALAPFDGVLILFDLPGFVAGWKEALVLGVFALSFLQRHRYERPPLPRWLVPAMALLAVSLLSAAVNPSFGSVLSLKVGFFYLLVPVALWWVPFNAAERDRLVSILMGVGVFVALIGIAQQIVGAPALVSLGYQYNETVRFASGILRSFSTFNQPFAFAFFVMTVMLVGVPVALEERRRRRNVIFMACIPILLVGMASAVVRAAFLGLGFGGLWLAAHRYRFVGHVLVPVVIALALLPAGAAAATFSSTSLFQRTTGWAEATVEQGIEPFGRGVGSVGAVAERLQSNRSEAAAVFPSPPATVRYQPDNYYVKTLVELGPIGLWLLVATMGFAVLEARSKSRWALERRDASLAAGITAATIAAITAALVSAYWEIFPSDLLFWLLLGVLPSITSTTTLSPSSLREVGSKPMPESSSPPSLPVTTSR
ncbi:MAG: O-antigen ligase domain-containing protein [Acidimicrobiales bacterium]